MTELIDALDRCESLEQARLLLAAWVGGLRMTISAQSGIGRALAVLPRDNGPTPGMFRVSTLEGEALVQAEWHVPAEWMAIADYHVRQLAEDTHEWRGAVKIMVDRRLPQHPILLRKPDGEVVHAMLGDRHVVGYL